MRVKLWGTRGSVANPCATTRRYGGSTPCVEVRGTADELVILDAGIGLHWLGQRLLGEGFTRDGEAHILLSHLHWDHIQGLPFFTPMLMAGNDIHVYGQARNGTRLRDSLLHQMERAYCPVPNFFEEGIGAQLTIHDLHDDAFQIGGIHARYRQIHHGESVTCLGYRLENEGGSLAYLSDVSYAEPANLAAALDLAHGVDLLIHDAHARVGETSVDSHATDADAVRVGEEADCGRVLLFHHHPDRTDDEIDAIVAGYDNHRVRVGAAMQGDEIRLSSQ